jgi:glutamyl-tRNA reductase
VKILASMVDTKKSFVELPVTECIKRRKHKPMFMVDLAVPRDIEPEVAQLEDIYLYSVDDLKDVIDENLKARSQAAEEAEDIVANQSAHFLQWVDSLKSIDLVKDYREHILAIKATELQRAQSQLDSGEDPGQVLQQLAHRLVNKIMHHPTHYLRQHSSQMNELELHQVKELLGLSRDSD